MLRLAMRDAFAEITAQLDLYVVLCCEMPCQMSANNKSR